MEGPPVDVTVVVGAHELNQMTTAIRASNHGNFFILPPSTNKLITGIEIVNPLIIPLWHSFLIFLL